MDKYNKTAIKYVPNGKVKISLEERIINKSQRKTARNVKIKYQYSIFFFEINIYYN